MIDGKTAHAYSPSFPTLAPRDDVAKVKALTTVGRGGPTAAAPLVSARLTCAPAAVAAAGAAALMFPCTSSAVVLRAALPESTLELRPPAESAVMSNAASDPGESTADAAGKRATSPGGGGGGGGRGGATGSGRGRAKRAVAPYVALRDCIEVGARGTAAAGSCCAVELRRDPPPAPAPALAPPTPPPLARAAAAAVALSREAAVGAITPADRTVDDAIVAYGTSTGAGANTDTDTDADAGARAVCSVRLKDGAGGGREVTIDGGAVMTAADRRLGAETGTRRGAVVEATTGQAALAGAGVLCGAAVVGAAICAASHDAADTAGVD